MLSSRFGNCHARQCATSPVFDEALRNISWSSGEGQRNAVITLAHLCEHFQMDFWRSPSIVKRSVDIRVAPQARGPLVDRLKSERLNYHVTIEDVQR